MNARHSMRQMLSVALFLSLITTGYTADGPALETPQSSALRPIDPSGTWIWEQRFGGRSLARQVTLAYEDGELGGFYRSPQRRRQGDGPPRLGDPIDLANVKLEGDRISFDVTRRFGDNEFTTRFAGVMVDDEIAGMSVIDFGGRRRESAWLAKRQVQVALNSSDEGDEGEAEPQTAGREVKVPEPMRVPAPGPGDDKAYAPQAILPGGIVMPLYPPDSPHLNQERVGEPEKYRLSNTVHGRINSIVNIHNPSIEVHFASRSMNTGSVVILAAGGGHRTLNVGTESADFVPYFYNYGVNTVILRNRLRSDGYEPRTDAVRDALQAIRLVRKNAEAWKFDPDRIGIMGFSAGAELSSPAAIQFAKFDSENSESSDPLAGISSRPDFVGIIYPGPTPFTREPETEVPRNTPPAFIASAGAGDRIHAIWATDYLAAMLRAGIPNVEMHIYGNGYHPGDRGATGGLTHRRGIPFGKWQDRFIEWFEDLGFLAEPGVPTKAALDTEEFLKQPPPRRFRRGGRRGRQQGQPRSENR